MKRTMKRLIALAIVFVLVISNAAFSEEPFVNDDEIVIDDISDDTPVYGDNTSDGDSGSQIDNQGNLIFEDEDNTASDEPDQKPDTTPSFNQTVEVEGVRFTLTAAAGSIPDGSTLSVEMIQNDSAASASESVLGDVETHRLYRIEVLDTEGNSIQPDTGFGTPDIYVEGLNDIHVTSYDENTQGAYEVFVQYDSDNGMPCFPFNGSAIFDIATLAAESSVDDQPSLNVEGDADQSGDGITEEPAFDEPVGGNITDENVGDENNAGENTTDENAGVGNTGDANAVDENITNEIQPVTVIFNSSPVTALVTVYPAATEENPLPEQILAQEDGSFLLLPGEYTYSAEEDGYAPVSGEPFTVEASENPWTITIIMEPEMSEQAAFDQSAIVDGVKVNVQADAGAFPEDAVLSVSQVSSGKKAKQADAAVGEMRDEDQNVGVSYTFDIKVIDSATNSQIQPADGYGVRVSFDLDEAADDNLEANVYHITGTGAAMTATKLEDVEVEGETVTAVTDGFSLYTVEFTYNDLEYVLPGDSSVDLSDILAVLDLTGEVTEVQVSNSKLFTAIRMGNRWVVEALQAFSTTEWMKVTINDVEYHVIVTDDNIIQNKTYICDNAGNTNQHDALALTASSTSWTGTNSQTQGWYVLSRNIEINDLITVSGNVTLILQHVSTLSAHAGINVTSGSSLTIYADSTTTGMGSIEADGNDAYAGIGCADASLTINGGNIIATGVNNVGIGGNGATINIIGGIVNASSTNAAGIGCIDDSSNSTASVSINGNANVEALGGSGKAGIGSSLSSGGSQDRVSLIVGNGVYVKNIYIENNEKKYKAIDKIDEYYARTNWMAVNTVVPDLVAEHIITNSSTVLPYYNGDTAVNQWVSKGGTLKLHRDIELVDTIASIVLSGKNYLLDLNGCGLIYKKTKNDSPVIKVGSGAVLTLNDSNINTVHRYTLSNDGLGFATVNDNVNYNYTTFNGGYITGGKAGGVYVEGGGSFIMNKGTIIGNNNVNDYGGGVVLPETTSAFTMSGGTITRNKAKGYTGSGVYLNNGTFNLYGSPKIVTNVGSNVYLSESKCITITGQPNSGMSVGVTMQENGDFTQNYNYSNYGAPSAYFNSDADGMKVLYNSISVSGQAKIGKHTHEFSYSKAENDNAIIITCANSDCGHDGATEYSLHITIPDSYVYGSSVSAADFLDSAALAAFNEAYKEKEKTTEPVTVENNIRYYKVGVADELQGMPTDVGNYRAELKIHTNQNGEWSISKPYTISQKSVEITGVSVENKVYDGTTTAEFSNNNSPVLSGVIEGDKAYVSLTGSATAAFEDAAAGEKKTVVIDISGYSLSGEKANNYKLDAPTGIVADITKRKIGLVWTPTSDLVYNGSSQNPTASATNLVSGDICTVNVKGAQKNAGTNYTAEATSLSNSNYALPDNRTHSFIIAPRPVELEWTNTTLTYSKQALKPTARVTNTASSDRIVVEVTGEQTNAGKNYIATASTLSDANYTLVGGTNTTTEFTIEQKEIGLNWSETSFIYEPGVPHKPTASATGLCEGDSCIVTVTVQRGEDAIENAINVGSYTAIASALNNNNYKLPLANTKPFSIGRYKTKLVWDTISFEYDGTNHTPTAHVTLLDGTIISNCEVTVNGGMTAAGTYNATASALSDNNYLLPDDRTVSYTIKRKEVGLTWTDTSLIYNGRDQHPEVTITGLVAAGSSCNPIIEGDKKDVGSGYSATVTGLTNQNYKLPDSNLTHTFAITQKPVDVTWSNTSLTYNKSSQQPTVRLSGVVSGDTCTVTMTGAAINAGNYTATISLDNTNYMLSTTSINTHTFTINKKGVGLTWSNTSFSYDGGNHKPTATATGVIQGDTCDVTVTGEKRDAGTHTATVSALSNQNYVLTSSNTKSFTITKKTVGLAWGNSSFAYDRQSHAPTVTVTGVVAGDTCTATVTGEKTNVGSYTARASALSNNNYALPSTTSQAFTITPKTVGLTWSDTALTYNGKSQAPKASATGLLAGDSCTVTVSGGMKDVGSYTATASKLSNSNYVLPGAVTQAFTIGQKEVGLTWKNTALTYNGKQQQPTVTVTGVASGDTCTATITGAATNAGSYTAAVSALSNANYVLSAATTQAYTISQKKAGLTWGTTSFTYDGASHVPDATATGLVEGDTCVVTVTGAATEAGSYTAKATGVSNNNYILSGTLTKAFKIVAGTTTGSSGDPTSDSSDDDITVRADPKGTLLAKLTSKGKTSLVLTWTNVKNVDGFDVFMNRGEKKYALNFFKDVGTNEKRSVRFDGLKKGVSYKACVKAYVVNGGKKKYVRVSNVAFALTNQGSKKVSNASKVTVEKSSFKLKKGATAQISASVVLYDKSKNPVKLSAKIRYVSSNKSVATVSGKGKIKAKKKGNCVIYCIAANGVYKKVSVKVK